MEYSALDNIDQIKEACLTMSMMLKLQTFIIATATAMISALKQSKDITKAVCWHQRKLEKKINHRVVGM